MFMSQNNKSSQKHALLSQLVDPVRKALPLSAMAGAAVIVLAALFCYLPSLGGGFIWDDDRLLTESRIIKSSQGLYQIWCTTEAVDFWPATNTALWIEWRLWGISPIGYHVANLILHCAASLLIWIVLRKLHIPGASLAALIFAVHPVNVESVAWIAQRKNTLSMLFFLLSILWYLMSDIPTAIAGMTPTLSPEGPWERKKTSSSFILHPSSFHFWYWLSLAAFVLAMLSKGSVAVLPVLLLGTVCWRRKLARWDLLPTLPFFAVAAVLIGVNIWFQTHGSGEEYRTAGFIERLLGAGGVIWFYLYKALLPFDLAYVYPQWLIQTDNVLWWLPLLAALVVTLVLWWYGDRWSRPFLFAWGFFCVSLLPVMGFTDVEYMECSLVADHYQYIAIIGVISLAATGWSSWRRQMQGPARWVGGGAAGVLVATLMLLSWQQSRLYHSAITLYQAALDKNPQSYIVHNSLGIALNNAGRPKDAADHFKQALRLKPDYLEARDNLGVVLNALGRKQDAIELFQQALLLKPDYPETLNDLGAVLNDAGQSDKAIKYLQQALLLKPDYPEAHCNLGIALNKAGRRQEAIKQFEQALLSKPDYPEAYYNFGLVLSDAGRLDEAIEHIQKALSLKPDYADAQSSLGVLLGQAGRTREAIDHFRLALQSNPDFPEAENNLGNALSDAGQRDEAIAHYLQALRLKPDYIKAHVNLADTLVQAGQLPKAIEHYRQALTLKPDDTEACFNLALAYAQSNRPAEALETARKALELARSQGQTALAQQINAWLKTFSSKLPE